MTLNFACYNTLSLCFATIDEFAKRILALEHETEGLLQEITKGTN